MAIRDPNKSARLKRIRILKEQRREIIKCVIKELREIKNGAYSTESSINALIGSKAGEYIDLKSAVINNPYDYKNQWLTGLKSAYNTSLKLGKKDRHTTIHELLTGNYPLFKKYLSNFLESSFLKHYEEHYKTKPKIDETEYWFGNNSDEFGILVTPRFKENWENDQSEIRHFSQPYWTISHVLETGLCYMGENKIRSFSNQSEYLSFFRDMVRRTSSPYQLEIADKYIDYVTNHKNPKSIPLLVPELRYSPYKIKHEHRLDFLIINPWSMAKTGFEFSPSTSHMNNIILKDENGNRKTQKQVNKESYLTFEKEMKKLKNYWRKYGVSYLIYTDDDLQDIDKVWSEMKIHLEDLQPPSEIQTQLLSLL